MKDMQHSGNAQLDFSHALDILIKKVDYYLKSGYYLSDSAHIALIKNYFSNLHNKILVLKTQPRSSQQQRNLYSDFCKVRLMLASSVFKSSCQDAHYKMIGNNFHMHQIKSLYDKCIAALQSEFAPTYEKHCTAADSFTERTVLIAPLRNRQQLDICLEGDFYHIPVKKLDAQIGEISHIAIYQSKNFYGKDAGIRFWAKVISCEKIKRSELKEIPKKSDELYYLFRVEHWSRLKNDIAMSGGGAPFSLTSLYLLHKARDVCELNFKDQNTHKLFCQIRTLAESGKNNVACHYRSATIAIENERISLYKHKELICSVSVKDYLSNPNKHFWNLLRFINNKQNR